MTKWVDAGYTFLLYTFRCGTRLSRVKMRLHSKCMEMFMGCWFIIIIINIILDSFIIIIIIIIETADLRFFFLDTHFFRPKIIVPKLYLKLEFDTEDQVLFLFSYALWFWLWIWCRNIILQGSMDTKAISNQHYQVIQGYQPRKSTLPSDSGIPST